MIKKDQKIMELGLKGKYFLVTGASSGFGKAVSIALINEGAHILINARREAELKEIKNLAPMQVDYIAADISIPLEQDQVLNTLGDKILHGAFINAGGPPAKSAMETKLKDWDDAYKSLVRWKVRIAKKLVQRMMGSEGGKLVFLESISVKQPVPNLVLSNAMRMAIVGYVKTLSSEVADQNIFMNILAPGYHNTAAMDRIIAKKADVLQISMEEARKKLKPKHQMARWVTLKIWPIWHYSCFLNTQIILTDKPLVWMED